MKHPTLGIVLALLLIGLFELNANAQLISLESNFKISDVRKYEIVRIFNELENGVVINSRERLNQVTIRVADYEDGIYLLECIFHGFNLDIDELSALGSERTTIDIDLKVEIDMSEKGEVYGIRNWEYVSKVVYEKVDDLIYFLREESPSTPDYVSMVDLLEQFKETPEEFVYFLFAGDLSMIFSPLGYTFESRDTLPYQGIMENVLVGTPIRSDGYVLIDSLDYETGFFRFIDYEEIKQEDKEELVRLLIDEFQLGSNFQSVMSSMTIDIRNISHHTFDYYTGWPLSFVAERMENIGTLIDSRGRHQILRVIRKTE